MNTENYFRVAVASAGLAFAMFFTGCGGGDSSGGGQVAPESLQGKSYNFSPNTGGQTAVSFTSPTDYTFQHETGAVEQGNYEAALDGNTWTATLINTNGAQQVYVMTFASGTGGSFVLKREGEDDRFGPFSARDSVIPSGDDPGGSTTTSPTTTGPGEDPTPSNEYTGNAPVSIAGRTMYGTRTFTSTGPNGQTHTYNFGNGTFHDEDGPEQADGTFVYNADKSRATMTLNYNSPGFVGDKHELTMNFTQKDRGTFQSTYTRGDGTTIVINGEFNFEPIP